MSKTCLQYLLSSQFQLGRIVHQQVSTNLKMRTNQKYAWPRQLCRHSSSLILKKKELRIIWENESNLWFWNCFKWIRKRNTANWTRNKVRIWLFDCSCTFSLYLKLPAGYLAWHLVVYVWTAWINQLWILFKSSKTFQRNFRLRELANEMLEQVVGQMQLENLELKLENEILLNACYSLDSYTKNS